MTNLINADEIIDRLWIGAAPRPEWDLSGFHCIVLCAEEIQPAQPFWPQATLRAPLRDSDPMRTGDADRAGRGCSLVAKRHREGESVLVTCAQGINRSALVTALALLTIDLSLTAEDAVRLIRRRRWREPMLFNEAFVRLICAVGSRKSVRSWAKS